MHIPSQVDYGIRALIDLAQNGASGPVRTADIANRQGIPEAYLARLLLTLRKKGIVNSQRGPQGGHVLALQPSQINLGMVFSILKGPSDARYCPQNSARCGKISACVQCEIWWGIEEVTRDILESTTIAQLVNRIHQGTIYRPHDTVQAR